MSITYLINLFPVRRFEFVCVGVNGLKRLFHVLVIILGAFSMAIGIKVFLVPNHFLSGGV
ncbi:MAG: YitT family protein, partial [Paenibacillus sp.]|nr:YitT family protein [Paenibacillus sp.]